MAYYCSSSDVGLRLGLNSAQRDQASTRLTTAIRRATIDIDTEFKSYGRATPSKSTVSNTLNGAVSAGATTITLTDASSFSSSGNGNIDGDSFAWSGKSSNDLTGCTGISADHLTGLTVQEGEFAHVLREICADLAAGYYAEDEATFQTGESANHKALKSRALMSLSRIAHLGSVD